MKVEQNIKYGPKPLNNLDVYFPEQEYNKILIHYHGGGIVEGDKSEQNHVETGLWFAERGILYVEANYSLYPNTKFPEFIIEAAQVVKYVKDNYLKEGVKLYVCGRSAGAYITSMLAFDKHYLNDVNIDPLEISGWILDSAQPTTHFHVLKEYGIDSRTIVVDEKGAQYFVNKDLKFSRLKLFFYTDDIQCRYEQNMLFYKSILSFNPKANIEYQVLEGQHCSWSGNKVNNEYPLNPLILDFINKD